VTGRNAAPDVVEAARICAAVGGAHHLNARVRPRRGVGWSQLARSLRPRRRRPARDRLGDV